MLELQGKGCSVKNPNKLRLMNGVLICNDGSSVTDYLREWAEEAQVTSDTPLNLIRQDGLERIQSDAWMYRHSAA